MNASAAIYRETLPVNDSAELSLRCPRCAGAMDAPLPISEPEPDWRRCADCASAMRAIDGIWRALRPGRALEIDASLSAYEAVRKAEGRWSHDADFYLALPWRDKTGRFAGQWKIRARSFRFLWKQLLSACMKRLGQRRLRVLDLGAGNGWMSYRLALLGHLPVAVDISVNRLDGLGAACHYEQALGRIFPRFQAEMSWLPFAAGQFDVAIFNASFHYARSYEATILEALRVLRPDGAILIVDSPTYRNEADGEAMKREKAAEFARRFGTHCGAMGGQEYLTPERLERLQRTGIRWRRYSPWYGWSWAFRPAVARIAGRRAPSRFHIYLGTLGRETAEMQ